MRYAVTGPRELSVDHGFAYSLVRYVFEAAVAHNVTEISNGCQYGVDTVCAHVAHAMFDERGVVLRGVVPKGMRHNTDALSFCNEVEEVEGGYLARNERLIEHADVLVAFPYSISEELRSGTWATVRRARKKRIPVLIAALDGTEPHYEKVA